MFSFLSVLLLYAILFFGGIRPFDIALLGIAFVLGFVCLIVADLIRGRTLSPDLLVLILLSFAVMAKAGTKTSLPLFAAVWTWEAARRSERSQVNFLYFLFSIGLVEALLGLFQYFVAPGWMLVYENPVNASSGTFINRNHFAGFLEMIVPVSLGLAYIYLRQRHQTARPYIFLLGGSLIGLGVLFSLSRMGIFSAITTVLFLMMIMRTHRPQRRTGLLLGMTLLGLVAAGGLWIGLDSAIERYGELFLGDNGVTDGGRMIISRDTVEMIADHPKGIGIGKYRDVFRRYQNFRLDLVFDHAHNDYLETIAEWGVVPGFLFWILIIFILFKGIRAFPKCRSRERRGMLLVCSGSIFAILLHSMADFNLQIPSNSILFFAFFGMMVQTSFRNPADSFSVAVRDVHRRNRI